MNKGDIMLYLNQHFSLLSSSYSPASSKKSIGEEGEKKQVKFSDNAKETTYEKDPDVTVDDEEGKNKSELIEMDATNVRFETDEEKLERLGKKYDVAELESKQVLKDSDSEKNTGNSDGLDQGNDNSENHGNEYSDDSKSLSETLNQTHDLEPSQTDINDKPKQVEKSSPKSSINGDRSNSESNENNAEKGIEIEKEDEQSLSKRDHSEKGIMSEKTDVDEAEQQNNQSPGVSDSTQDSSDNESKKDVKPYQQQSYSLNSRQKSSQSLNTSPEKSTLHVSAPEESLFLTPRDIDLTESSDKDLDVKTTADDATKIGDSEQTKNNLVQETSYLNVEGGKEGTRVTNEHQTESDAKATEENTFTKETEKAGEKEPKVQNESPKHHVKLNLSNEDNTNKGKGPVNRNTKAETHIKTDFRQGRPVQTTATKVTVKATSEKKAETKAPPSSRSATSKSASSTRSISPREIAARERAHRQRKAQSARPSGRGNETARSTSSRASSRTSGPPSRPRSCGAISARGQMKEFFQAELRRLKQSLGSEAKKFKKPKVRDHYPDVYTSLVPYCSTYEANFLINMPVYGYKEKHGGEVSKSVEKKGPEEVTEEDKELMFTTRSTAIRLCDPWHSLNMDRNVLPKLETAELRQRRMDQMRTTPKPKSPRQKRPEAKQGSTRLPKFPVIQLPNQELTTKELYYGDVPMIRDELTRNYSHNGEERKKSDYKRTKQDFFRMELDRLSDYHKTSRPHMRAAYYAYLQNTPGSRKALVDCMREIQSKKEPQPPQAVA